MQNRDTKKTVLLVDDEPRILTFLKIKLKISGFQVITATNGKEALDAVSQNKPDIILLDIVMPVMDGLEFLEKLRSFSQIPVIVLSAKGQTSERALDMGANDFIPKPFKPDDVVQRVCEMLGLAEAE